MSYLPFIPDEFASFQTLANDNGWTSGHLRGSWFQHDGQNLWTECFEARRPPVLEGSYFITPEELQTWWTYSRGLTREGRWFYYLQEKSFKRTLRVRKHGGGLPGRRPGLPYEVQEHFPKTEEEWTALFHVVNA